MYIRPNEVELILFPFFFLAVAKFDVAWSNFSDEITNYESGMFYYLRLPGLENLVQSNLY